jgi:formate--tetrahydrofolate ligase
MHRENLKSIIQVARKLGIHPKYLETYGSYKAKVSLELLKSKSKRSGKYIVVTGITPTHLGEGKTVTTIGLSMALNTRSSKAVACIREPSIGPFFGIKGGGVGGGRSIVMPADDINLHLTGDIHAVGAAHNLCAAFIDNHLFHGNRLGIDKSRIYWGRVVDINDRALRSVRIALGGGVNGVERDTRFDITAASELMAILALAESIPDLRKRIGKIVVGLDDRSKPVTCEDLKVAGAMAALLKDALRPNLVQTSEGTPCFIHTGPFANITHGNSSVVADRIALSLADYVVTESGFGADCGLEKFIDIKTRSSGLCPSAVVLVASVRALKIHSGIYKMIVGRALDKDIRLENVDAVEAGSANLEKQIENVRRFNLPCVVAINRFPGDSERELAVVRQKALQAGAFGCAISDVYRCGSRGGIELAEAVRDACKVDAEFKFLYSLETKIKDKIATIAKEIYGAKDVRYEPAAEKVIAIFEKLKFGKLPVCMAKTPLSLSHDPELKGVPSGFTLPVRDVRPSVGAGFVYVICGKTLTMPALPSHPVGERVDIDPKGKMIYVQ